jgi:Tol biopolymer transport system component
MGCAMRGMLSLASLALALTALAGCTMPVTTEPMTPNYETDVIGPNMASQPAPDESMTQYTAAERHDYAHPNVSYDGMWLAYAATITGPDPQIFVQKKGGHAARQITTRGRNIHPSISYDSKSVAFASNFQGKFRIYVASMNGVGPLEEIGDPNGDNVSPSWAPDGKRLAYASRRAAGEPYQIVIHDRTSSQTTTLCRGVLPDWSPDGMRIAYQRNDLNAPGYTSIYTIKPDGSEETMVYHSDTHGAITPAWAGKDWILFATVNKSSASLARDNNEMFNADDVWMVKADGTQPRMVTSHRMADWDPCYDNKAREIVYVSNRGGVQNIYGMKSNLSDSSGGDGSRLFSAGGR